MIVLELELLFSVFATRKRLQLGIIREITRSKLNSGSMLLPGTSLLLKELNKGAREYKVCA